MNEDTQTQPADEGRRLSDQLGPLPDAMTDYPDHGEKTWREEDLRAYAMQERAAERERWKQAAEEMAQEADHKFTMDGTVAHWLRALVAKRGA